MDEQKLIPLYKDFVMFLKLNPAVEGPLNNIVQARLLEEQAVEIKRLSALIPSDSEPESVE